MKKNSQSSPYNKLTVSNLEDKNKNLKKKLSCSSMHSLSFSLQDKLYPHLQ